MFGLFGLILTWPNFWSSNYATDILGISGVTFWPICTAIVISIFMFFNILLDHVVIGVMFYSLLVSRYLYDYLLNYMPRILVLILISGILLGAGVLLGRFARRDSFEEEDDMI